MKARKTVHNGNEKWVVQYTEGGKRRRKFFKSERLARLFISEREGRASTLGRRHSELLREEAMREAATCLERLAAYDRTLTDAVDFLIKDLEARGSSKTLGHLVDEFLDAKRKAGKSPRYMEDLEGRTRAML